MSEFQVIAFGIPASTTDCLEAMRMDISELPELSEGDRQYVERFGLDKVQHQRSVATRLLAEARESKQGKQLGRVLQEMLKDSGSRYTVTSVRRRSLPLGWDIALLDLQQGGYTFTVAQDTSDLLAAGMASTEQIDSFRDQLFEEIGSPESFKAVS